MTYPTPHHWEGAEMGFEPRQPDSREQAKASFCFHLGVWPPHKVYFLSHLKNV